MKTLTIILSLLLSATFSFAQFDEPCLPEGIAFYTQQQIDNFQTDYPDCHAIGGNVLVIWGSDITNLNGLNVLTSIGGSLTIGANELLTDLTGLENLTLIGGNFYLFYINIDLEVSYIGNPLLTSLEGLNNLKSIGGDFEVISNKSLVDFSGLENLDSIQGNLIIGHSHYTYEVENNGIVSLEGLDNIDYIGGNLTIVYNDSLTSLNSLDNLAVDSINNLFIHDNVSLSECNSQAICNYLSNPNGIVEIHHNAAGCNSPAEIAEDCGITLPCLPYGNYYFNSQDDIDNFQSDYPDCYELSGDIYIDGDDISNMDGLNIVSSIDGDLTVHFNQLLSNLQGLENLTSIGGNLDISGNASLTSLSGIENLSSIGGDLNITYNSQLSQCDADAICAYLSDPNGIINISNNDEGCSGMIEVAVACGTTIPCLEAQNYVLLSQFDVDHFPVVFPGCTDIMPDLYIGGDDIVNLDSLYIITSIGGELFIYYTTALTTLTGLENLSSISGSLYIYNNDTLNSLTGLENLSSIGGSLIIYNNDTLISLTGLDNLSSIGGRCAIGYMYGNDNLTSLTGLENLSSIGGEFWIQDNITLASMTGLENLTFIGGSFTIYNNDSLTSMSGLENLSSIGGGFNIRDNNTLFSMTGLENLISIEKDFWIEFNDSLTTMTGLENLSSIGGELHVWANGALTSLSGLENIDAGSIESLSIAHNISLSTCEVQSICDYLTSQNGYVLIAFNAPGCNSQQEVKEACWIVHIEEGQSAENQFTFYPNPVTANAKLSGEFPSSGTVNICIFNTTGLCIKRWEFAGQTGQQEFTLNLNELPPGIYFLRLQVGNEVMTKKVVKL